MSSRALRLAATCLATLAMLMAALAPAWSHAMGDAGGGSPMDEICTTAGVSAAAPGAPHDDGAAHPLFQHCPYCALHVDTFPVPPAAPRVPLPAPLADAMPAAFLHADVTSHVWVRAQPRAPPVLG